MFRSVINSHLQVIDCRTLKLSGTYFALPQDQADEIARRMYDYINVTFGSSFVLDWKIEKRALKDMDTSFHAQKLKNGAYIITGCGNVLCESVYNKTTLQKHIREVAYPAIPPKLFGSFQSVDHAQYYDTRVRPFMDDPIRLKTAIHTLFDLEDRLYLASCQSSDLLVCISSRPMKSGKLFEGSFKLEVPLYCLCDEVDLWGERFYECGKGIAEAIPHTNIYIQVTPEHALPYTCYYGLPTCKQVPALSVIPLYQIQELYFSEIGWAHFISKETLTLGENRFSFVDERILLTECKGGGKAVRVRNSISTTTIADLKSMKRYLYSLVLPRAHTFPLDLPLRRYWEYVPVFENELTITEKGVQFQHYGQIDVDKVQKLLGM